ncbi:MAG: hypothetical protein CMN72_06925 [Sphingomonas sp.]|nr:hypothetical protein [Sphingomonas sp.]
MRIKMISAAVLTMSLAACNSPETQTAATDNMAAADNMTATDTMMTGNSATAQPTEAMATLQTADGKDVGTVTAMQLPDGVKMTIKVNGLPAGPHGAHIHDVGTCTPNFMASGPHWAPFDKAMGLGNESTADDSKNAMIEVGQDGNGTLEYTLSDGVTLAGMMEGDGSSFMIHERKDNPGMKAADGNGDRIACGVFKAAS